jgi:hypothetical protein
LAKKEIGWPPVSTTGVAFRGHAYGDAACILLDGFQCPYLCTNNSVGGCMRIVSFASKPWKADRNATADCFAFFPTSVPAEKNHFFRAGRLPGRDLSAVQVHFSVGLWPGYGYFGQSAFICYDPHTACDTEAAIKFRGCENRLRHWFGPANPGCCGVFDWRVYVPTLGGTTVTFRSLECLDRVAGPGGNLPSCL